MRCIHFASHCLPGLKPGIVVSLALMLSLPGATWERLAIWMAAGFIIYFSYSRRRSRLAA